MTATPTASPQPSRAAPRREAYPLERDRAAYDRGYARGCNDGLKVRPPQWNDGPDALPYRRGYAHGYADGLARNPNLPPPDRPPPAGSA